MPTRRPLELKAVAMKIPKVPPQTNTSNVSTALSSASNVPRILETTCWGSCTTAKHMWKNFPNIQRIDSTTFRGIRIKQEERKSMIRNEVHLFEQSKYQTKAGPTFLRHYMSMPHQHHQLHHSLKYPPLSSTWIKIQTLIGPFFVAKGKTHTQDKLKWQQRNLGMGTRVLEGIDCAMNLWCLEALWLRLWTNGVTNGHWETPLMNPRWSNTMSSKIIIQSNSTLSFNEFPTLSSLLSLSFEAESCMRTTTRHVNDQNCFVFSFHVS